ncbi:MAG: glycoside hydrolase family 18 [Rikenellaceae bacterium]|nr:glycoside hydrolase family 18 [Rikenellaceae bacterium]
MKYNRKIWILAGILVFAAALSACSDWTDPHAKKTVDYDNTETNKSEEYYRALREYKKSDHSLSFGWFSSWGEGGVSTSNMLAGLPDSMDMVSIWSNGTALSQSKIDDLRLVQEKKGTKVLICTFIQEIGKGFTPDEYNTDEATREAFWGWVDGDESAIKASMEKYAGAIMDTINKYGYDGLDIDFEPNVDAYPGKLDENRQYVIWMIDILSKYLGPQSNTGKMLVLDGELYSIDPSTGPSFDYLIGQAYSVSGGTPSPNAGQSEANMESRLARIVTHFKDYLGEEEVTNKFIVTENLESAIDCLNGGYYWTTRDGIRQDKDVCPSLVGMAMWEPENGYRKGGFGGFRFDAEAMNNPAYKWMRRGIQAQNPARE